MWLFVEHDQYATQGMFCAYVSVLDQSYFLSYVLVQTTESNRCILAQLR